MFRILHLAGLTAFASLARFAGLVFAAALILPLVYLPAAMAADTAVTVPWGDWLAALLTAAGTFALAVITWALRFLPAAVKQWCLRLFGERVDQLLERAVQYGLNATAGAVKGKTLTFDVGSEVARQALDYAIGHAPGIVAKIGGLTRLREKIIARLDFDEAAEAGPVA